MSLLDLKEPLQTIDGVGDKTADKVIDVVDECEAVETIDPAVVADLEEALSYHDDGQYEYARKFLHRIEEGMN